MKKKHIKMSDCTFYIDEQEGVVVCLIPDTRDDFLQYLFMSNSVPCIEVYGKVRNRLYMPRSFCGKAKCAEGDVFDLETGKMIAFQRARFKYYNSFFKRANLFVQEIEKQLDNFTEETNKIGEAVTENTDRMDKRLSEILDEEDLTED